MQRYRVRPGQAGRCWVVAVHDPAMGIEYRDDPQGRSWVQAACADLNASPPRELYNWTRLPPGAFDP